MKRAWIAILVAVAAGLALPGSGAGEARTAASACVPDGAEVVARSRDAVVVRRLRTAYTGERVPHHYGCLLSHGRLVLLDENDGAFGWFLIRPVRFAGRYVAHVSDLANMGLEEDSISVVVTDLRRGRTVSNDCTAEDDVDGDIECFPVRVVSLVLKETGGVAWIDRDFNVMKHDRGAREPERVDMGRRVERRSLRVRGSQLSWVNAGRRRTATLR